MKKIYLMLTGLLALLATACHDPEMVEPTAERQGLTSITAYFTSGQFVDQELAKLTVTDENATRYVIPVPYFYPETSDDETTEAMKNVRVRAEIDNNCKIEPTLTILDLTQENHFTYTNAKGESRDIVITGERVKSSKCELLTFALTNPALSGVIDEASHTVSLISADDLSSVLGTAEVSAHATISPDPAAAPLNYNSPVEFTVTAHDGVTKQVYTVSKSIPEKIASGFNAETMTQIFNFDPVSNLGLPDYSNLVYPSMAAIGGNLVISLGNGTTPIYLNRITGVKLGEINLGSAQAGAIASDEADHMLIANVAAAGATVNIYKTSSVTAAPTLFYSFTNDTDLPTSHKMKVIGDIDNDAMIVFTLPGVDGVTNSSRCFVLTVQGGVVVSKTTLDLSGLGINWGPAPVNTSTVVAASADGTQGYFHSQYSGSTFNWIKPDMTLGASIADDNTGWGLNPNCLDTKRFNNVDYAALLTVSHFPSWGMGPQLYLLNVNDKTQLTGASIDATPALAYYGKIDWYQTGAYAVAAGDVIIAPSADGFTLYIYYYDHNSGVIGGYRADCIKR